MKQHTLSYKNNIKEQGRELDIKITYDNIVLDNEVINSVNPRYQGALLKSVMKELEIDSNVAIPKGTEINFKFGISLDNSPIEYLDFGNYIVKDIEKQEDSNSYLIKCYDKMLYSMKSYESLGITYPCTIRAYINALCTKLNLNFKNKADTFVNFDKILPNELYLDTNGNDIGFTYRDVFDELAEVTASTICLDTNDNVEIRYINETNDTIDEEYLKDVNVTFGEKFGPINSVVLSRNGEDNIYRKDDLSVQNNGLYEVKITDNQIMNFNNRDEYIDNIFNKLKGTEYYLNDFSSTGITYYDLLDKYIVRIENKIYNCIMFNDNIEINQGLVENINTEKPEESQTDYSKADKTDRRINQTYRIVDKQNQTIQELITKTDENGKTIVKINKSLDGISADLVQTTAKTNKLEQDVATNQASFEDFRDNEYIKSIGNLQDQIDGAIQFWNGAEIPTLNNYPANMWKTENDRINHTADIYTVIKDVNGQMKQGKGYRFDKVGGTWQWVELTDNELSAVQAIADEANKRSKVNSTSIKTLEDKNVQVDLTLDGIKTEVSNNTTEIKQVTETSKLSTGTNDLTLDNALASNVLDYKAEGNTKQDGVPNPDYPQEVECLKVTGVKDTGKNLFDKSKPSNDWYVDASNKIYHNDNIYSIILPIDLNTKYMLYTEKKVYFSRYCGLEEVKYNANEYRLNVNAPGFDVFGTGYTEIKTTNSKINYVIISYYNKNNDNQYTFEEILDSIMIYKGTKQEPYEPYKETQANIDLQGNELCKIVETKDLLHIDSNGKTTIEKRFEKYVFTGDEIWSGKKYNENPNTLSFATFLSKKAQKVGYNVPNVICNYFERLNFAWASEQKNIFGMDSNNIIYFRIGKEITTVDQWKQWLKDKYNSGNPVYVIYELETPQIIELADTNITLFEGTNNLSLLANMETNTSCKYLVKTPLSDTYYTKTETNSQIKQTDEKISSEVKSVETKLVNTDEVIGSLQDISKSLGEKIDLNDAETLAKLEQLGKDINLVQSQTNTNFEQTNKSFEFQFNEIIKEMTINQDGTNEKFKELKDYIRFEQGNIVLGKSGNPLTLTIQNDRISYKQNGVEIAYFSNNQLYVPTGIQIGKFAFIPRENGSLSFRKVVD